MNKELEALERIKNIPLYHVEQDIDETYDGETEYSYHEEYDGDIKDIYPGETKIIEDALKRLENYEKNEDFSKDVINYALLSEEDKIKKLKALEVIKNKNVDLQKLRKCFWEKNRYTFAPLDFYNAGMFRPEYLLTKEEYALLREVL